MELRDETRYQTLGRILSCRAMYRTNGATLCVKKHAITIIVALCDSLLLNSFVKTSLWGQDTHDVNTESIKLKVNFIHCTPNGI